MPPCMRRHMWANGSRFRPIALAFITALQINLAHLLPTREAPWRWSLALIRMAICCQPMVHHNFLLLFSTIAWQRPPYRQARQAISSTQEERLDISIVMPCWYQGI